MIKYRKNCKVCQAIKKNHKLADDIYKTTAYDKTSKVSLNSFHKLHEDEFGYKTLLNHVKKHQGISQEDLSERHLQNIVKQAEKNLTLKQIESKDIWQNIMDLGMEELKEGNIKIKVNDMLRAAKDKSDYDIKVKDQELAMIEMIYHFTSGEDKGDIRGKIIDADTSQQDTTREPIEAETTEHLDTTEESSGDPEQGEERPSGVYYPPTWDAATFRTSEVSEGDHQTKD